MISNSRIQKEAKRPELALVFHQKLENFQMLHKKRNKDGVGTRLPLGNRNKLQRMLRKRRQTKQKETRAIGFNPVVKKCLSAFYEGSFGSAAYMYADGIDPYGVYNPWLGDGLVPASPLDEYLSQDTVQ